MKQSFKTPSDRVRPAKIDLFLILKTNKALMASLFFVCIFSTGILGFTFGGFSSVNARTDSLDAYEIPKSVESINVSDTLCTEIEKIDTARKNQELIEVNKEIEEASNTLEETILGALMSNYEDKRLSSRSSDVDSYVQEARNLMDLDRKIEAFKKTDDYNLIDLSEYESAVKGTLERIPTLKPIPGTFPGYGWRRHPIFGYSEFHAAADQNARHGTNIRAAATGYVVTSSYSHSRGNYIIINHGNGFTTTYMHNSANLVSSGQSVKQGEVIGRVGSTGWATGPHLHFEVAYNGVRFDPRRILIH